MPIPRNFFEICEKEACDSGAVQRKGNLKSLLKAGLL
jgi:hypothetical protein